MEEKSVVYFGHRVFQHDEKERKEEKDREKEKKEREGG